MGKALPQNATDLRAPSDSLESSTATNTPPPQRATAAARSPFLPGDMVDGGAPPAAPVLALLRPAPPSPAAR
eukprot:CAMPEP_0173413626 /NCGR_PEP_ID=MMETSP1356-20130122/82496_1 /TAXON_ID=77927 ORGANISM="Hemiselmis virescens, Strain PCC157" /NCGR_SAMPLE_ID=MMETSP1356 /ASSEMBLY_ACC=CAM_ASM_000847 /LENGTH=71 /DNA_ID=CAMNT_0014375687 /DNA_START=259 /DNA_END=471 /DNA_ORIENTATION=+